VAARVGDGIENVSTSGGLLAAPLPGAGRAAAPTASANPADAATATAHEPPTAREILDRDLQADRVPDLVTSTPRSRTQELPRGHALRGRAERWRGVVTDT
jgi:hypothetical protein